MSQDEKDDKDAEKNFLSRWSQRKRDSARPDAEGVPAQADQEVDASPARAESDPEQAFDLSRLPKLEEITEATDITGFLRKGVPESLRNAALRKSWALDPAIRNYVNPALDYAYDWNTPGGVPGNSELATGSDIAKMVLQIMGRDSTDEADAPATAPLHHIDASDRASDASEIVASQDSMPEAAGAPVRLSEPAGSPALSSNNSVALATVADDGSSDENPSEPRAVQQSARRHGSAKPRV